MASNKTYSQEGQSAGIRNIVDFLNRGEVAACFLANFKESKDDDRASFGVLRYGGDNVPFSRKLGFYAYKSYVLSSSSSGVKLESANPMIPAMLPSSFAWLTGTAITTAQVQTSTRIKARCMVK